MVNSYYRSANTGECVPQTVSYKVAKAACRNYRAGVRGKELVISIRRDTKCGLREAVAGVMALNVKNATV